jgi:hypothetical protein
MWRVGAVLALKKKWQGLSPSGWPARQGKSGLRGR